MRAIACIVVASSVVAFLGGSSDARAETAVSTPTPAQCIEAADLGQKAREANKLVSSRTSFITCSSSACPTVVRKQCTEWLAEVDKQIPTVNLVAKDANGSELVDVEVMVDDAVITTKLDGNTARVDPGQHVIRFRAANATTTTELPVVFRSGQKDRLIELKVPAPAADRPKEMRAETRAPAPPHPEPAPAAVEKGLRVPTLAWIGLGAAVVGTGTFVTFAALANDREGELRRTCAPSCPASDRDALRTDVVFGNVGLGLAVAGLGVTVVSTILANRASPSPPTATGVGVAPMRGGAAAAFTTAF